MLVIAPLRPCYLVWPQEREDWTDFHELRMEVLHGPGKDEALRRDADVYVVNPDGLPWLLTRENFKLLDADMLVVDESNQFKTTSSKRFKLLRPLLPRFRRRVILTGTPSPEGYEDLFGQIFIVDLGAALGAYITHYRMKYFHQTGFGGYQWKLQDGADKKIEAAVKPLVMRLDADDYLELPELVESPVYVDLPPTARKLYDKLEVEMLAQFEDGETTSALTAATASIKCRQVACGGVYLDEEWDEARVLGKRPWREVHSAKTDAVLEIIAALQGSPALIAYEFQHDLERLLKALGKNTPYIGGGVSPKKSREIERAWNAGEITTLVGHPAAIGHGLNLQKGKCRHIIWHSLTWSRELYDQFNRRIRRQGNSANRVFVYPILARDTVEVAQWGAVKAKGKVQAALLDALKTYLSKKLQKGGFTQSQKRVRMSV